MPPTVKPGIICGDRDSSADELPVPWQRFIRFCRELRHGEIDRLVIQDGVPVVAETVTKKIKFT